MVRISRRPNPDRLFRLTYFLVFVLTLFLVSANRGDILFGIIFCLYLAYIAEGTIHDHGHNEEYWHFQIGRLETKLKVVKNELEDARQEEIRLRESKKQRNMKKSVREASDDEAGDSGTRSLVPEGHSQPCPQDLCPERDPLDIAPIVVWTMVFDRLDNTDHVMNCYYTCGAFRTLLEARMIARSILVLDDYLNNSNLKKHLSSKDFLHSRLVCKSWKMAIDHFLQNHPSQGNFSGTDYPITVIDSNDTPKMDVMIQQFIQVHPSKNVNPFPSRHVMIKSQLNLTDYGRRRFHTYAWTLLNHFGDHVWYLNCNINKKPNSVTTFQVVYDFLRQTPNLKLVSLHFNVDEDKVENGDEHLEKNEAKRIQKFTMKNPFPNLKNMKSLIINGAPDTIIISALKMNNHIKKLEVSSEEISHEWIKSDETRNLRYLTDCTISNVRSAQLAQLENVHWQLTRLTLIPNGDENEPTDLVLLFKIFQKFQNTLKFLNFKIKGHLNPEDLRLHLPHLEELHVHFENTVKFDFIVPLTSLKIFHMIIYDWKNFKNGQKKEIVHLKDHGKIKISIWQLLPALNSLSLAVIFDTREHPPKGRLYEFRRQGDTVTRKMKNTTFMNY